jgi:hypothetical protein
VADAEEWRLPSRYPRCRRKVGQRVMCPNAPVADMRRMRTIDSPVSGGRTLRKPEWWAYCAEHMYGNWIEDGKVVHWKLIEAGS